MREAFLDTNVLLYLIASDEHKADTTERILARGGHISVQVLNEFMHVARRKAGLAWTEVDEVLTQVRRMCRVHPLRVETHDRGRVLAERYRLSIYDALIVASAESAKCRVLLTEDLQHGQRFESGLRVRNPFVSTTTR